MSLLGIKPEKCILLIKLLNKRLLLLGNGMPTLSTTFSSLFIRQPKIAVCLELSPKEQFAWKFAICSKLHFDRKTSKQNTKSGAVWLRTGRKARSTRRTAAACVCTNNLSSARSWMFGCIDLVRDQKSLTEHGRIQTLLIPSSRSAAPQTQQHGRQLEVPVPAGTEEGYMTASRSHKGVDPLRNQDHSRYRKVRECLIKPMEN